MGEERKRSLKWEFCCLSSDLHFEAHPKILQECAVGLAEEGLLLQVDPVEPRGRALLDVFSGEVPV